MYFLIAIDAILLGIVSYLLGYKRGITKEKVRSLSAFKETMDDWMEAQKEAGITDEQMLKINEAIGKITITRLDEVLDGK